MKKLSSVIAGSIAPICYFLIHTLLMYLIGIDALANNILIFISVIYILPTLPGIALIFAFKCDSLKAFSKKLITSFLTSCCIFIAYHLSEIDLATRTHFVGYDEIGLGEGVLVAIPFFVYIASCAVGSAIAGIITADRNHKHKKLQAKAPLP